MTESRTESLHGLLILHRPAMRKEDRARYVQLVADATRHVPDAQFASAIAELMRREEDPTRRNLVRAIETAARNVGTAVVGSGEAAEVRAINKGDYRSKLAVAMVGRPPARGGPDSAWQGEWGQIFSGLVAADRAWLTSGAGEASPYLLDVEDAIRCTVGAGWTKLGVVEFCERWCAAGNEAWETARVQRNRKVTTATGPVLVSRLLGSDIIRHVEDVKSGHLTDAEMSRRRNAQLAALNASKGGKPSTAEADA
jgi:hypothetical protein